MAMGGNGEQKRNWLRKGGHFEYVLLTCSLQKPIYSDPNIKGFLFHFISLQSWANKSTKKQFG